MDLRRAIAVEHWSRGASPLHALDARVKLVIMLIFLIMISITRPGMHAAFAIYAALLLIATFIARLPLGSLLLRAMLVLPFTATFAVITWWSGDSLRAISMFEKSLLCGFTTLLLIATTPLNDLLAAMERLGVPRSLVLVTQFLYRYLFVIAEQAQRMRMASQSRGGSSFRRAGGALGVLFARSWERSDAIHRAMLARGFQSRRP